MSAIDVLREIEWSGDGNEPICPGCGGHRDSVGHAVDCTLDAALREPTDTATLPALVAAERAAEREEALAIVEQWHLDPVSEPALRSLPGGSPPTVVFEAIARTVARVRARGTS